MHAIHESLLPLAVPIATLNHDPANARKHGPRNMDSIRASLARFTQRTPLVVQRQGMVVRKGNGTLEAAKLLGWDQIAAVIVDEGDVEATAYAIADNRTAELAEWDDAVLGRLLSSLGGDSAIDVALTGFNEHEIAKLAKLANTALPADIDDVPEAPKEAATKPGDLYLLGQHRLLCGDATREADLERLMDGDKAALVFTDPPYGVDYDGGTKPRERLVGDTSTDLYAPACLAAAKHSDKRAALYLWHAGVKGIAASSAALAAGYVIRCELVWNKNQAQFGSLSAQYKQKHEPAYYCFKKGQAPRWFGPTNEVTVWDVDRSSKNEFHPTQKPVELAARAMRNSSEKRDLVLDLFLGSGSTLVAAEVAGRRCYGLELSPAYCDVIVARWEKLSGGKAERRSA